MDILPYLPDASVDMVLCDLPYGTTQNKAFFASHKVEIIFVEQDLPKTFENELVADIMSLMTSFTATLHSRRKRQSKEYRKRMEQDGIVA